MAKGFNDAKERRDKVSLFGKTLVRRSKSKCEMCGESKGKLNIYEAGKKEIEPDYEMCLHICDDCLETIERIGKANENDLRFLNRAIWSEENIVKAVAIDLIKETNGKYSWIDDLMDMVYIDEELKILCERVSKK